MGQGNILNSARFKMIGIEEIDSTDHDFALEWPVERGVDPLADSVKKAGVLEPLWVVEKGGGQYRLLDGFRRLAAARKAGLEEMPALILSSGLDQLELFKARLARLEDRLSAVEASRVIERLAGEFSVSDEDLAATFLPLLGFGSSRKILGEIRRLNRLEDSVARFCARKGVALRESSLWANFPTEGQQAILVLVRAVKPGQNLMRNYLQLLGEIALRDSLPVQDILIDKGIRDVMLDPQMSKSGGREIVHRILRQKRNPVMRKIEKDFHSARKELKLPEEVSLEPPPFFEGDFFTVSFKIKSAGEFKRKAEALHEASRKPAAGKLFGVLGAPREKKQGGK